VSKEGVGRGTRNVSAAESEPGLPPPSQKIWLLLGVAIKLTLYALIIAKSADHALYQESGDSYSYLLPAENLLHNGDYIVFPDQQPSRAMRMPAYSLTYLVFRIFLAESWAKTALVLLQVIVGGLSVALLARVAFALVGSRFVFFLVFGAYAVSPTVSFWDYFIRPDGLAASSLVFCVYFLTRPTLHMEGRGVFIAGLMFAYSVFLRPFLVGLLLPFGAFIWSGASPRRASERARFILLFLAPLATSEAAWMGRNYAHLQRLVPLQLDIAAGAEASEASQAARRWVTSFGGSLADWKMGTIAAWLSTAPDRTPPPVPAAVSTSECDVATMSEGRYYLDLYRRSTDPYLRRDFERRAASIFERCRLSYIKERPFDHRIGSRLRLLLRLLRPEWPSSNARTVAGRFWLLGLEVLDWAVAILGTLGVGLLFAKGSRQGMLTAVIPVYIVVVFVMAVGHTERRYLASAYPFLVEAAGIAAHAGQRSLQRWRRGARLS
jgi:hypothetical protein